VFTLDLNPPVRTLRQFAAAACVLALGAATAVAVRGGSAVLTTVFLSGGVGLGVVGVVRPWAVRLPYALVALVTFPIGFAVSHVVLAVLYFGVITPIALLSRLVRPDPLSHRFERDLGSYWRSHKTSSDTTSYLRQA
jgi:hypothetical protein